MRPQGVWRRRGPSGCPECGGLLLYDRDTKTYTCQSCGRVYTREELAEARRRIAEEIRRTLAQEAGEEKEQYYREYLKWYLSSKKE
ncbi:hypothetical protein DRO33_00170 [Candidatus Bathyarchaeota archaeon]|nr:MAG: hypothetical protein DRO33_00170 [Candidatus Bathyarchaeota archaeon]